MQNQTFKLSLKPNDYPPNVPYIYADQYDEGRTFVATVYDADGSLYNFNGETVTVVGTKPSGTGFSYTATASGNTVTFETTGQMTVVAGNVTCGIIIEKDGDRIGTLHFVLHIQPAALSTDTIIDSDDFGSIITDAVEEWMDEHGIVIDDELETPGAAADAKATGDALNELKSAIEDAGLSDEVKEALLACFANVAWIGDDGQDYYDALEEALYNTTWAVTNNLTNCTTSNEATSVTKGGSYSATITASTGYVMTGATVSITMGGTDITSTAYSNGVISIPAVTGALVITISAAAKTVSSISAVYTQSGTVFETDSLDSLKTDLVVTATYTDSSTAVIPSADYTLSGALTAGTSAVTVTYSGVTTTFNVTVTAWDFAWDYSMGKLEEQTGWHSGSSGTGGSSIITDGEKIYSAYSAYYQIVPDNVVSYKTFASGYGTIEVVCYGVWNNTASKTVRNLRISAAKDSTNRVTIYPFNGKWRLLKSASGDTNTAIADASNDTEYTVRIVLKGSTADIYINGVKVSDSISTTQFAAGESNNLMHQNGGGSSYYSVIKAFRIISQTA